MQDIQDTDHSRISQENISRRFRQLNDILLIEDPISITEAADNS